MRWNRATPHDLKLDSWQCPGLLHNTPRQVQLQRRNLVWIASERPRITLVIEWYYAGITWVSQDYSVDINKMVQVVNILELVE